MGNKKSLMKSGSIVDESPNLFIGGIAGVINTPELLALKFDNYPLIGSFTSAKIKNFTIIGNDIQCYITSDYAVKFNAFNGNTSITYFIDRQRCIAVKTNGFVYCSNMLEVIIENLIEVSDISAFNSCGGRRFILPKLLRIMGRDNDSFEFSGTFNAEVFYFPKCIRYGMYYTSFKAYVFHSGVKRNANLYAEPSMATINNGSPEGDVAYIQSQHGGIVRYVTDYTVPNPITNPYLIEAYSKGVKIGFTAPSAGVNAIDFYEVYINGFYHSRLTSTIGIIPRLSRNTNYSLSIVARDIYYNESSKVILEVSTNNTDAMPAPVLTLSQFRGIQAYIAFTKPTGLYAFSTFKVYVNGIPYANVTTSPYSMLNRVQGVPYNITATQVDIYGLESEPSNILVYLNDGSVNPLTVSNFTLTPRGVEAYLTFSIPANPFVVYYRLYRNGVYIVNMSTTTPYRYKPVPFNVSYNYQILTVDQYNNTNNVLSDIVTYINDQQYKPEQITSITTIASYDTAVKLSITIPNAMFPIESYSVDIAGVKQSSASNVFTIFGLVHNVATNITVTCTDIYGNISDVSPVFSVIADGVGTGYVELMTAYLKFDNNVTDSMGYIAPTALGTPVYEVAKVGSGIKGITTFANAINTNQNTLTGLKGEFTISGIYKNNSLKNENTLFAQWDNPYSILLRQQLNGVFSFYLRGSKQNIENATLYTNTDITSFHHIVLTYDGTFVRFYFDKILRYSVAYVGNILDNLTKKEYLLGGQTSQFGNQTLDEWIFWKQGVNQAVVTDLYDKQMNGISIT